MHSTESWETNIIHSFKITAAVVDELRRVKLYRKTSSHSALRPASPLADIAEEVVKNYIDAGAKGVPR
jgi:hypothetical protein